MNIEIIQYFLVNKVIKIWQNNKQFYLVFTGVFPRDILRKLTAAIDLVNRSNQ